MFSKAKKFLSWVKMKDFLSLDGERKLSSMMLAFEDRMQGLEPWKTTVLISPFPEDKQSVHKDNTVKKECTGKKNKKEEEVEETRYQPHNK